MTKRVIKFLGIILCFITAMSVMQAQPLTVKAGTVCTDSVISVPVSFENVQGIGGFKLRLRYNKAQMFYTGYTVLNPSIATVNVSDNFTTGSVTMFFSADTMPISMSNSTVLELHFGMTAFNNTLLVWDTVYFWNQAIQDVPAIQIYGAAVTPPLITLQPVAANACAGPGQNLAFKVQAVGTMHTYRWQLSQNGGNAWVNLSDGSTYSGVLTPTLSVDNPDVTMHNYLYRCHLSGYCDLISNEVPLNIITNILTHPQDVTLNAGGTALFTALGSGSAPSYLWEVSTDGGNTWNSNALFPPVTTPNITLSGVPQSWNGYMFRCLVAGACAPPPTPTQTATLFVGAAGIESYAYNLPIIFPNPVSDVINIHSNQHTPFKLAIFDLNGRQVFASALITATEASVVRPPVTAGVYLFKFLDADGHTLHIGRMMFAPE